MLLTAGIFHFQEDVVADPQKAMECPADNVRNFHHRDGVRYKQVPGEKEVVAMKSHPFLLDRKL